MDSDDELDAVAQAELVARGDVSPAELVEAAIARIERLDPIVRCVVSKSYDRARDEARSSRLPRGPFSGVPLLLKDFLCERAGEPYFEGLSLARDKGWRARRDSELAGRFQRAGFIILGRTSLSQLAKHPTTEPPGFPATRNPWDLRRSPGGSSGGSAAAVASGMVAVAHANDGTGSIRIPASCCGLVGFKASRGRVPDDGLPGFLDHITQGVLTRTVRDSAAVLDAIGNPLSGEVRTSFLQKLDGDPAPLRIGFVTRDEALEDLRQVEPRIAPVSPVCVSAVDRTALLLSGLGHHVEESNPVALRGPSGLGAAAATLAAVSTARHLERWADRLGVPLTGTDVEAETWESAAIGSKVSRAETEAALQRMRNGICRVIDWWDEGWDILVTPAMSQPAPPIGQFAEGADEERRLAYLSVFGLHTVPYSYSGQPAISLPLYWTEDSLPIGVQLVAAPGNDAVLLQLAAQLERTAPWNSRRPTLTQPV